MELSFSYKQTVPSEWVDYNGHMNDAEYNRAFSLATDAFIDHIGLDEQGREHYQYTIFTLETHTCYLKEMHEGKEFEVTARVLDYDVKRIHLFLTMSNADGEVVATLEEMLMGIDQNEGRPAPFPNETAEKIAAEYQAVADQERPKQLGRTIGIRRK
ncbi:thioesterase family protein [Halobacillus karajensis]|uniref:L-carnitine dehydrogenase n=1 Tax=Halobacillus karajensis TaxID=195088 RepID=A0A024P940_9BACI|nr:thioesterase family protein [Halobacillus karajensis]CDQ20111.1 L-carnitine dehydrogenase [Halobacillus karajensis]CDQ25226.1 L-carnitine dehydrogenase [Halobacillus karajensis]CDQ28413.1 L-carnitine dehydrogenase [Halobacillus karajensis]